MTRVRDLIFTTDPYADLDHAGYEPETQGGGGADPLFAALIKEIWPRRILEIGAWKDAAALPMAPLLDSLGICDAEIICVDPWLGSLEFWLNRDDPEFYGAVALRHGYPSVYNTFLKNVAAAGFQRTTTPFPVSSTVAATLFMHHYLQFDLIYIDGSHDYDSLVIDILKCSKLLSPRGVLFGGDYDWPSVRRAVGKTAVELGFTPESAGQTWVSRNSGDYMPNSGRGIKMSTTLGVSSGAAPRERSR